jgi:hypothetical protein
MQIKKLADELNVTVTLIKNWLRTNGYARADRNFAGAPVDLTREEERAVRAAHKAGELKRNRAETTDVERDGDEPDAIVSSEDLADLPRVEVGLELLAARDQGRHAIFIHAELLEWLGDPRTPVAHRRVCTRRIQELMAYGRATRMRGVTGKNAGWLRTPLGGNSGSQFYLWLLNKGEAVHGQDAESRALLANAPTGARLLRDARHHNDTSDILDVGAWSDCAPLTARRRRRSRRTRRSARRAAARNRRRPSACARARRAAGRGEDDEPPGRRVPAHGARALRHLEPRPRDTREGLVRDVRAGRARGDRLDVP